MNSHLLTPDARRSCTTQLVDTPVNLQSAMIDDAGNVYFNGTKIANLHEHGAVKIVDSLYDKGLITSEEFVEFHKISLKLQVVKL